MEYLLIVICVIIIGLGIYLFIRNLIKTYKDPSCDVCSCCKKTEQCPSSHKHHIEK